MIFKRVSGVGRGSELGGGGESEFGIKISDTQRITCHFSMTYGELGRAIVGKILARKDLVANS